MAHGFDNSEQQESIRDLPWSKRAVVPALVTLIGLAIVATGFGGEYQRFVGIQILVSALLAVSFRGLFRIGVFSLAGPGFMGLGAYSYALLQLDMRLPALMACFVALLLCLACACLTGPMAWRVTRIYLALLTLSLVVVLTMIYGELRITGAHGGRSGIEPFTSGGVEGWRWFLTCVIASSLLLISLAVLEQTRLGRAWRAIGVNEAFAESVGVRTTAHSYWAFVLYSTVAAFAGVILAANNGYIYPSAFGFERVVFMLLCVFVGGVSTFIGPLVGSFFVGWLQEFLSAYQQYTMLILGSTLVLVILILPDGIVRLPAALMKLRLGARPGAPLN